MSNLDFVLWAVGSALIIGGFWGMLAVICDAVEKLLDSLEKGEPDE